MKRKSIAKALVFNSADDAVRLAVDNKELRRAFNIAKKKLYDYQVLFEKQHDRSHRAEILWREANGKPDTSPDLGTLLQWLTDRGDRWRDVVAAARGVDACALGHFPSPEKFRLLNTALKRYGDFWHGVKF